MRPKGLTPKQEGRKRKSRSAQEGRKKNRAKNQCSVSRLVSRLKFENNAFSLYTGFKSTVFQFSGFEDFIVFNLETEIEKSTRMLHKNSLSQPVSGLYFGVRPLGLRHSSQRLEKVFLAFGQNLRPKGLRNEGRKKRSSQPEAGTLRPLGLRKKRSFLASGQNLRPKGFKKKRSFLASGQNLRPKGLRNKGRNEGRKRRSEA